MACLYPGFLHPGKYPGQCEHSSALPKTGAAVSTAWARKPVDHLPCAHSAKAMVKGRNLGFPAGQPGRVPCRQGNVAQLLLDVSVVRAVGELVGPLRRLVALNLLLGRSLWTLVSDLLYKLTDAVGWLSAPPRNPLLRSLGQGLFSVRRWHYTLGAARPSVTRAVPTCHLAPAGLIVVAWCP